jgi:Tol biopolymer transport system component
MVSKQRWTMMTGALALAGSVCFVGLGAREAAAEPLRLAATHQQVATKSNGDGTATVTLAVTLTNTGSVAAEDVHLILLKGPGLPVKPGENVLTVGTLAVGQMATLSWPVTVLAPVPATRYGPPLMVIHAEGIAADGTTPVSTGVLSRARNQSRAKASIAESATEPVTADAAMARCGSTERVSVDSAGNQGNNGGDEPAISADGRFVAFVSADNLVPGDTNDNLDIFVHDRKTGATERVSVDSAGNQANVIGSTSEAAISADGRFVAFNSANNLVPGDTNDNFDIFVHDRKTGATERVSVDSAGNQGNGAAVAAISADGRFVAFQSVADNLVLGDTNGAIDVFVHDRKTGATERVSVDSAGNQANYESVSPAISGDGRFVAFVSLADNLVPGDTNGTYDVFVHQVHHHKTKVAETGGADLAGE